MDIQILSFLQNNELSVVQFSNSDKDTFSYITGTKAIKEKKIEVFEVSNQGSVNNISVINHSKEFVFFADGDILSGAKQNRVLNTSVLLAPESKTIVPVSCVEAGRWRFATDKFTDSDYSAPAKIRFSKAEKIKSNPNTGNKYYANQNEVWDNVSDYVAFHRVDSSTSNLSDVYETHKSKFEEFIKNFSPSEDANGMAIFSKNKLLNIDIYNRTNIYNEYFLKNLRAAAIEIFNLKSENKSISEAEAKYKTVDFLDKLDDLEKDLYKGVGVGEEKRFGTKEMTGFELIFNLHSIHTTAINISKDSSR